MGKPLAPRQGRALSQGLVSESARRRRANLWAGVAGRNEVVTKLSSEIVKEDAIALADALRI
jgi:hypothetical protein